AAGHLYISQGVVREVSEVTGRLTTPAGATDVLGPPASGVPASRVNLGAWGAGAEKSGNLVSAAAGASAVRVVAASTGTFYGQQMTAGDIYTVAGDGTAGFSGDRGPAIQAELNGPQAVAVDGHGNLVVADHGNNRVRVVAASTGTFYGQQMTAGDIYTVAADGVRQPTAAPGATYTSGGARVRRTAAAGVPAPSAPAAGPTALAADAAATLVHSDSAYTASRTASLRVVAARSGAFYGQQMTAGDIYAITP